MSHHINSWPSYPPWDLRLWNGYKSQTHLIQIILQIEVYMLLKEYLP